MKIKKILKKVGISALVMSMLIPVVPSQAAKLKLNKTKVTTYYSGSESGFVNLKVKGAKTKVKWSCKKKDGKISAFGKYNAECNVFPKKKEYTFTVTAKVGKKKLKCKIIAKKKIEEKEIEEKEDDVGYITYYNLQYNKEYNEQRIFFSLLENDGKTRTSSSGILSVSITNDSGENVYNQNLRFTKNDFSEWSSLLNGTSYKCCVRVPNTEIIAGKNTNGTASICVTLDDGKVFKQGNVKVDNLPQIDLKEIVKVNLPTEPIETWGSHVEYKFQIYNIRYEVQKGTGGNYDLKIWYDGKRIPGFLTSYDAVGFSARWKLMQDGICVNQKYSGYSAMYVNDAFKDKYMYIFDVKEGVYDLVIEH